MVHDKNIVIGDLRRGEDSPVEVSSKFGWLIWPGTSSWHQLWIYHTHIIITAGFES